MSKLQYREQTQQWAGAIDNEEEHFRVWMSDATFRRHFNAYLEYLGIPTQTYLEMMDHVNDVMQRRYVALQNFTGTIERWRGCDDPEVRVFACKCKPTNS